MVMSPTPKQLVNPIRKAGLDGRAGVPEMEKPEDLLDNRRVFDEGHDPHRLATVRTAHGVEFIKTRHCRVFVFWELNSRYR